MFLLFIPESFLVQTDCGTIQVFVVWIQSPYSKTQEETMLWSNDHQDQDVCRWLFEPPGRSVSPQGQQQFLSTAVSEKWRPLLDEGVKPRHWSHPLLHCCGWEGLGDVWVWWIHGWCLFVFLCLLMSLPAVTARFLTGRSYSGLSARLGQHQQFERPANESADVQIRWHTHTVMWKAKHY